MLQLVAPFTIVIYDWHIFIIQATGFTNAWQGCKTIRLLTGISWYCTVLAWSGSVMHLLHQVSSCIVSDIIVYCIRYHCVLYQITLCIVSGITLHCIRYHIYCVYYHLVLYEVSCCMRYNVVWGIMLYCMMYHFVLHQISHCIVSGIMLYYISYHIVLFQVSSCIVLGLILYLMWYCILY